MTYHPWRLVLSMQAVVAQASWVGVRLIIGYRALGDGADPVYIGILASSFALPGLLFALPVGRLADRFGGTGIAFIGLIVATASIALAILIPGLIVLLVASVGAGLGNLLVMVGQQTFIAHVSVTGSRDSAYGTFTAAASIGQMIGPPAVTILASTFGSGGNATQPDTSLGLLVCATFSLMGLPFYFSLRRTDRILRERRITNISTAPSSRALSAAGLWRSLVVSGAVLVTVDLVYAFIPVWATEFGISATAVGLLLALRAAVSVASRLGLSHLVGKFGRKALLITSIAAAAIALAALPFVGVHGAAVVMIGLGLGLGIPQPLTLAWVTSLADPSRQGAVLGLRTTVNRLAQITLPIAVGSFAAPLGVLGIFWANAVLLTGAIIVVAGSDRGENTTFP